jgi:hypothetical protein
VLRVDWFVARGARANIEATGSNQIRIHRGFYSVRKAETRQEHPQPSTTARRRGRARLQRARHAVGGHRALLFFQKLKPRSCFFSSGGTLPSPHPPSPLKQNKRKSSFWKIDISKHPLFFLSGSPIPPVYRGFSFWKKHSTLCRRRCSRSRFRPTSAAPVM